MQVPPSIHLIKNGRASDESSAWIGDAEAFARFQQEFHSVETPSPDVTTFEMVGLPQGNSDEPDFRELYSKSFKAMKAAIEASSIQSVGGFIIPLASESGNFKFQPYARVIRPPISSEELPQDSQWTTLGFGNGAEGACTLILSGELGPEVALHIHQAPLGIVYTKSNDQLYRAKFFPDIDEIDFSDMLNEHFGFGVGISVNHNLGNFGRKGHKCLQGTPDPRKAIDYFDRGILVASRSWSGAVEGKKPEYLFLADCIAVHGEAQIPDEQVNDLALAFYYRGIANEMLGNNMSANKNYREALKIAPDMDGPVKGLERVSRPQAMEQRKTNPQDSE